ncbi:hypothetical protein B5K08_29460 [Rhizobium leguminosarum bv. trifolii]|uniref:Secreted protein n=1 Tax=Rhizobium leguminosarum bv. trifolii TaxID=386 RepID=A0A3E1B0U7_RHILT|nr:hypothetical protein [Rhizobium leguminosarum]RFB83308.1 hypothetical protein B5K10_29455 [Rhizobium leguminosarum bv. trifolii]RFB83692.1 hypothetical protein B5K08_29460 [Rhizobium leguminosarum bv. trifolii]
MKRFSNVRTLFFAPIVLIGLGGPAALAGQNECAGRAADIIRRAYPSATDADDGTLLFEGATITLPKDDNVDGDPHAVICRVWPAQPQLMLIAVPLMIEQSDSENEGDIELLVVDSTNLQIKRLRLDGLMSDDAVRVRSVAFDTARYRFAPGRTAFGLRVSLEGSSRANPFGETTLWLFSIEGDGLKPVLDNIVVGESHGEWDTVCAGEFSETTRTLSMVPSAKAAVADIVVTEKTTTSVNTVGTDNSCNSEDKTTIDKHRLQYDGSGYGVPKDLKRVE